MKLKIKTIVLTEANNISNKNLNHWPLSKVTEFSKTEEMHKKPLRLRIRENQKESYTFHKQAVQAKKNKTVQNKHNQALTTISFSPKLLIDLYTLKSTQNIHDVSEVNGDTERFKRVPEDSLPQ